MCVCAYKSRVDLGGVTAQGVAVAGVWAVRIYMYDKIRSHIENLTPTHRGVGSSGVGSTLLLVEHRVAEDDTDRLRGARGARGTGGGVA